MDWDGTVGICEGAGPGGEPQGLFAIARNLSWRWRWGRRGRGRRGPRPTCYAGGWREESSVGKERIKSLEPGATVPEDWPLSNQRRALLDQTREVHGWMWIPGWTHHGHDNALIRGRVFHSGIRRSQPIARNQGIAKAERRPKIRGPSPMEMDAFGTTWTSWVGMVRIIIQSWPAHAARVGCLVEIVRVSEHPFDYGPGIGFAHRVPIHLVDHG